MISLSLETFAIALAVIGAILMGISIVASPFSPGMRYVGLVFLVLGVIVALILLVLT